MIWIDSSFAIEWLYGTARAKSVKMESDVLGILPAQYAEILVFVMKQKGDIEKTVNQLEALSLEIPTKTELKLAAQLFQKARTEKSKASLADAQLAAVAISRAEALLTFDKDFSKLGMSEKNSIWRSNS